jgi:DnaD/phage-associated family protein
MTAKRNEFDGFPAGKQPQFVIPSAFISDLLPRIDDLAELKVTLYFIWAIQQREGRFRYLRRRDFLNDEAFMAGLAGMDFAPDSTLDAALGRACQRGTLLYVDLIIGGESERLYFINTELGREAFAQVQRGEWKPGAIDSPVEIIPDRPNIYRLYEDNIGPLTPLIADTLRDAEKEYPMRWIEDAIRVAVESNARKWSFVQAVLDRWHREGKQDAPAERPAEQDGRRYVTGKYADFIEH